MTDLLADGLQGIEAGGHGGAEAPPLAQLVTAVLAAIPDGPPVLAAGGVATGAQVASLLTLGASGVVAGTRFLYTHECQYSAAMKEVLIEAGLNATARGMAFDEVTGLMGWPENVDGRAIANSILDDEVKGLGLEERVKRYDEGKAKGEKDRLVVWAGVGVGLTSEKGTAAVCRSIFLWGKTNRANEIIHIRMFFGNFMRVRWLL